MARADHINPDDRLDHFAEMLSLDIPIPQIRQRMGLSIGGAHALMTKLRKQLGPQAI